jgi:hypothetical protein
MEIGEGLKEVELGCELGGLIAGSVWKERSCSWDRLLAKAVGIVPVPDRDGWPVR